MQTTLFILEDIPLYISKNSLVSVILYAPKRTMHIYIDQGILNNLLYGTLEKNNKA